MEPGNSNIAIDQTSVGLDPTSNNLLDPLPEYSHIQAEMISSEKGVAIGCNMGAYGYGRKAMSLYGQSHGCGVPNVHAA